MNNDTAKTILVNRLVENRSMSYLGATALVNRVVDEQDMAAPESDWVIEELEDFWEQTVKPLLKLFEECK